MELAEDNYRNLGAAQRIFQPLAMEDPCIPAFLEVRICLDLIWKCMLINETR